MSISAISLACAKLETLIFACIAADHKTGSAPKEANLKPSIDVIADND
ncbi:hypothetical protein [Halotalea alkalilenta]|nr:hypothetical protein [Halotalea alkalilenta]